MQTLPRVRLALLGVAVTAALGASPAMSSSAHGGTGTRTAAPTRLVVQLEDGVALSAIQAVIAANGLQLEQSIPEIGIHAFGVQALQSALALAALERHPTVEGVHEDAVLEAFGNGPNDTYWSGQWGMRVAGFEKAWKATRGLRQTRVAVVDTGVDRSHQDLSGVLPGRNLVREGRDPVDDNGHGTAVAGVLAAVGDNGRGVAGACWTCSVLPVKALDAGGSGYESDVAAGIVWAVDHGARVINLSLGAPSRMVAVTRAIAYAARHDVVVVAAAGNEGVRTRSYPAADDNVIAVAASDPEDRLYSWSNRGTWVGLAAPGCNVTLVRGGGYGGFCGTSSAAPLVAGLAALIRSAHPAASAAQTERILRSAATQIGPAVDAGRLDATVVFPAAPTQPPRAEPSRPKVSASEQLRSLLRGTRLGRREAIRRFSKQRVPSRRALRLGFAAMTI